MRFLVTGATGYIGSACVKRLLEQGHDVVATTRNLLKAEIIQEYWSEQAFDTSGLFWHELNFNQPKEWQSAIDGVDFVIHMASPLPKSLKFSSKDLVQNALLGVKSLMQAVQGSCVKRVVLTSSIAAMRNGIVGKKDFDYLCWSDLSSDDISDYAYSKTYAEITAWNMHTLQSNMPEMVSVLPGFVVGAPAYPLKASASVKFMRFLLNSRLILPGGFHFVALSDVVDLHIAAALKQGAANMRFPCCTTHATDLGSVLEWLRHSNLRQFAYEFHIPEFMIPKAYRYLSSEIKLHSDNTKEVFGWKPSSIEESVLEMARFLRNNE